MPILIQCGGCQAKMNAPDTAAGKKVKCPKCSAIITVPGAGAAPVKSNPAVAKSNSAQAPAKRPAKQDDDFAADLDKLAPKKSKNDEEEPRRPAKKAPSRNEDDQPAPKSRSGGDDMLGDLPEDQADLIRAELQGKERILWAGKPLTKVYVIRALPFTLGTLVCWGIAVVTFATFSKDKNTPAALGLLLPIGLLLMGAGFLMAPFLAKKRAGRTFYALTNKRGLVWNGGWFFGHGFEEYNAMRVSNAKRQNSWIVKGAGDLVFKEEVHITTTTTRDRRGRHMGTNQSVQIVQYGFIGIADVNEIERLIRREITAKVERALEDD